MTDGPINNDLVFRKCSRGFMLHDDNRMSGFPMNAYAFDTVEQVAAFLCLHFRRFNPRPGLENNQD